MKQVFNPTLPQSKSSTMVDWLVLTVGLMMLAVTLITVVDAGAEVLSEEQPAAAVQ